MRLRLVAGILTLVGCGLDVVGRAAPAPADGHSDAAASLPVSIDAGEGAADDDGGDGGAVKPALCPASADLLGCFAWEGSTADGSPRRITLELSSNLTFAPGREGLAARFTLAPKSDVRLPFTGFNTAHLTIEAWINASSLPATRALVVDLDARLGLRVMSDGTFSCTAAVAVKKVTTGTWMHVACVHDGATTTTYVDGVAEASAGGTLGQTSSFIGIGQNSPTADDNFDGLIDNLRIWSTARSAADIAAAAAR